MMREIKFRAWDGEKFGYVTLDPSGTISIPSIKYMGRRGYSEDYVTLDIKEGFQQYTGIKDKNGKEIYEGDILHTDCYDSDIYPSRIQTVVADKNCPGSLCFTPVTGAMLCLSNSKHFEIIGNIYENPELMEANDETDISNTTQSIEANNTRNNTGG